MASLMPPARRMWLVLMRVASERAGRGRVAPAVATAARCTAHMPGTVLRVQSTLTPWGAQMLTNAAVWVATPERCCRKFSATRSPARIALALPDSSATVASGVSAAPSASFQSMASAGSTSRKTVAATAVPASTPPCLARIRPREGSSARTMRLEVTSPLPPAGPRSSARARRASSSISRDGNEVRWIQEVAHFTGDSLELSRRAAATDAEVIVFCGVHFMAETAKILSPDRTVLIPDMDAGCSLADSITGAQLRAWKDEHPGAVVVAYVNTSAEVKAESAYCGPSATAVQVVQAIPAGKEILFLPDMFLAAHVERQTGRKLEGWMGEGHVHAGMQPA